MKKFLFPVVMLLFAFSVQAQQKSTSFELSINGGMAIPTGHLSRSEYADQSSGYSRSGGHINITGTYFVSRHVGIGALIGFSQFGFKGAQNLADGYKEDSGTDSTTLYTKGKNRNISVLVGPSYRISFCRNLSLDVRLMAGYVNTHLAGFSVFYEDYTDNVMTQNESSGGGFGYQTGAGLHYALGHHWGINLNADYFSSKPRVAISYENFIVNSGRKLGTYDESLSGVTATAGLLYRF